MRALTIPERAWKMLPERWLLRFRRGDGGWDTRTFRGSLTLARKEAQHVMKARGYESVWIVEHEERKL